MSNRSPVEVISDLLDKEIVNGKLLFVFPAHELSPRDSIVHEVAMRIGDDRFSEGIKEIRLLDLRNKKANELVKSSPIHTALASNQISINPRPRWFVARL